MSTNLFVIFIYCVPAPAVLSSLFVLVHLVPGVFASALTLAGLFIFCFVFLNALLLPACDKTGGFSQIN